MKYGFVKVASAVPAVKVADVAYNIEEIKKLIALAEGEHVEIVCFPELCITGYSCQDLFRQQLLQFKAEEGLLQLLEFTLRLDVIVIVGMPRMVQGRWTSCSVVIQHGAVLGEVAADGAPLLFRTPDGVLFGIETAGKALSSCPATVALTQAGADIIFCPGAMVDTVGRHQNVCSQLQQQSAVAHCGYVYASAGFGESTTDVVYGGNAFIIEDGSILAHGERFSLQPQLQSAQIDIDRLRVMRATEKPSTVACSIIDAKPIQGEHPFTLERAIDPQPFLREASSEEELCLEVLEIQTMALAKRLLHTGMQHVVLGISGGLDSTLALLVCVRCFDRLGFDRKGIVGVTMPGFGTSDRTHDNAASLMQLLGISQMEIPIAKAVKQHFTDIGHDIKHHDATYENAQARERTQILMDLANKLSALVVGTGDLSELALGWATYNGDHMSMYGVNAGIPKTVIQHVVRYVAQHQSDISAVLLDIVDTPISPELTPADKEGNIQQKTEDLVGPYELHDFFLYYFLRYGFTPAKIMLLARKAFGTTYSRDTIQHWLNTFCRRFFSQQFKRSCSPDGPKVFSISLSPRGDWRMPSDASSAIWLSETTEAANE